MKKSMSAVFLALTLLLALLLPACKASPSPSAPASSTPPASGSTEPTTSPTTPAEELPPVELLWYTVGMPQDDIDTVLAEVNKTLTERINATLKLSIVDWGSYDEKMKVIISSGENYDMCFTSNWSNGYLPNVGKGAFLALDDLIAQYGQNLYSTIPEGFWNAIRFNGKLYAMINYQLFSEVQGVLFQKDLVEKYNFDLSNIKTLSDLDPIFATIKENEPGMTPYFPSYVFVDDMNTGWVYDNLYIGGPAVDMRDPELKVINFYETEQYMNAAMAMRDMYNKGYIRKDAMALKDTLAEVKTGKYFAFTMGSLKPGFEAEQKAQLGFDVVGVQLAPIKTATSNVQGTLTGISVTSKNPERAVMLYDLLYSDASLYNLLCHGIEGKHYTKLSEDTIRENPDAGYAPGLDWEFGCQFNGFLLEGQQEDLWDATKELMNNAPTSPLLGFNVDTEPFKSELAELGNLGQTYDPILATGSDDPEVIIPEFLAKMKAAGIDRVMEEVQRQIDQWRKDNNK